MGLLRFVLSTEHPCGSKTLYSSLSEGRAGIGLPGLEAPGGRFKTNDMYVLSISPPPRPQASGGVPNWPGTRDAQGQGPGTMDPGPRRHDPGPCAPDPELRTQGPGRPGSRARDPGPRTQVYVLSTEHPCGRGYLGFPSGIIGQILSDAKKSSMTHAQG